MKLCFSLKTKPNKIKISGNAMQVLWTDTSGFG